MASWGTASSGLNNASELNGRAKCDPNSGSANPFTAVELSTTPPINNSDPAEDANSAAKANKKTHGDPCPYCRRRTTIVDSVTGNTQCNTRSCQAYRGPHKSKSRQLPSPMSGTDLRLALERSAEAGHEQVPNEEEDSSDESPLLSSANSRQGSDVSMDGGASDKSREDDEEHCHSQATFSRMVARELRNQTVKNRLLGAVVLTTVFAIGEFAAGWYVNSTAIRTDACHMFADVATLAVSYTSARLSSKEPTASMNFGYARTEALGALLAISVIYSIAAFVTLNAVQKIISAEYEVLSKGMIYAGACAVAFNVFLFFFLRGLGVGHAHSHSHGHSHGSNQHRRFENDENPRQTEEYLHDPSEQLNLRAAILHALGDICASSFVLVVAIVIYYFPGLKMLDPIAAIVIALLIFKLLWSTLMDSCRIQLNAIPAGEDYGAIQADLRSIPGVIGVHELRLFAVSTSIKAASVHLSLAPKRSRAPSAPCCPPRVSSRSVRVAATRLLRDRRGYDMVTVQVERQSAAAGTDSDVNSNCVQCKPFGGGEFSAGS